MEPNRNRFFNDTKFAISTGIAGLLVVCACLAVFLIAQTFKTVDGDGMYPSNVVTLTGDGEVVSVPDVATFSYTVSEVSEDVTSAQDMAAQKSNSILEKLKENGIEEKDIKTLSYNVYPKYEWKTKVCAVGELCGRGENVLVGQEVTQRIQIKVRDTAKAGDILSLVGKEEVSNVSGLQFSVDDEDVLKAEAREMAIKDAKEKASVLAKQLGVKIKDVVSFSEDNGHYGSYGYGGEMMEARAYSMDASVSPELPTGENTISTRVYITFEIEG